MKLPLQTSGFRTRLVAVILSTGITLGFLTSSFRPATPDEGMFLLNQIHGIGLQEKGLRIPVSELYNPTGVSLIDALVRLDGCTGSFVSPDGLIITNHHCAFGAAAALSSKEKNYIEKGFYAESQEKEAKTTMTCKITQSYLDVSEKVLKGVSPDMSYEKRNDLIAINSKALIAEESAKYPDLKIEISQMSVGKLYTLFRYRVLTDIRLVYVPPRSVGEFGGESDNWVWPRHNADFSFVRAYENGKPFNPKKYLNVSIKGLQENDFVFILGYPGRTFRHQAYRFLEYQRDCSLPFIADWYEFRIRSMHEWAGTDETRMIKVASPIKSLANTSKNFRGKLQGLTRTAVLTNKRAEQDELIRFVNDHPELRQMYAGVIQEIDSLYRINIQYGKRDLIFGELYNGVGAFYASAFINNVRAELSNLPNAAAKKDYLEKNRENLKKTLSASYRIYDPALDLKFLEHLLGQFLTLPADQRPAFMKTLHLGNTAEIHRFVSGLYKRSVLKDPTQSWALFDKDLVKFFNQKEPMRKFAELVNGEWMVYQKALNDRNGRISALMPKFTEIKMKFYENTFIPDANSTLRFTFGRIKGYYPEDAVYNKPFTTISGILEKAQPAGDYFLPDNIMNVYKTVQPADVLVDKSSGEVCVAMLYNLDTTGGNSGSPVLDADGNLIGVNFDRAFTACINDYAWNEEYSRSIGVDIRYVLYVMKYIGKTDRLLTELKVPL